MIFNVLLWLVSVRSAIISVQINTYTSLGNCLGGTVEHDNAFWDTSLSTPNWAAVGSSQLRSVTSSQKTNYCFTALSATNDQCSSWPKSAMDTKTIVATHPPFSLWTIKDLASSGTQFSTKFALTTDIPFANECLLSFVDRGFANKRWIKLIVQDEGYSVSAANFLTQKLIGRVGGATATTASATSADVYTSVKAVQDNLGGTSSATVYTKLTALHDNIGGTSSATVKAKLDALTANVGGNAGAGTPEVLYTTLKALHDNVGGTSSATVYTKLDALHDNVGGTSSATVYTKLSEFAANVGGNAAAGTPAVLYTTVKALHDNLGGTSSATVYTKLSALHDNVGGTSSATVKAKLDALHDNLGGTSSATVYTKLSELTTNVGGATSPGTLTEAVNNVRLYLKADNEINGVHKRLKDQLDYLQSNDKNQGLHRNLEAIRNQVQSLEAKQTATKDAVNAVESYLLDANKAGLQKNVKDATAEIAKVSGIATFLKGGSTTKLWDQIGAVKSAVDLVKTAQTATTTELGLVKAQINAKGDATKQAVQTNMNTLQTAINSDTSAVTRVETEVKNTKAAVDLTTTAVNLDRTTILTKLQEVHTELKTPTATMNGKINANGLKLDEIDAELKNPAGVLRTGIVNAVNGVLAQLRATDRSGAIGGLHTQVGTQTDITQATHDFTMVVVVLLIVVACIVFLWLLDRMGCLNNCPCTCWHTQGSPTTRTVYIDPEGGKVQNDRL